MLGIVSGKPTEPPSVGLVGKIESSKELAGWDIAMEDVGGKRVLSRTISDEQGPLVQHLPTERSFFGI
jgi:hypothetical protein